jgi:site-specific recombinase XerD
MGAATVPIGDGIVLLSHDAALLPGLTPGNVLLSCNSNTITRTAPNKGAKLPGEVYTGGEIAALLGACPLRAPTGIRNRAMIMFLYRSGLRVSEITGMRPAELNQAGHSVRVLGKGRDGGKVTVRGYHPSADDALARWLDTRAVLGAKPGAPVFCTLAGDPMHPQHVRNMLKRLRVRAGIAKRVHPHGLRHTYAVELLTQGVPIDVISKLLGHSSIAVTARYLDHLTNQQAIDALQAVDFPALPA